MKQCIQGTLKNEMIKKEGCYFLCLLRMAEINCDCEFTENSIEYLYDLAVRLEFMKKDCTVLIPHQLVNLAMQFYAYVSTNVAHQQPNIQLYIEFLQKPGFGHFVVNDNGTIWDPLDPARPGAKDYRTVSYRVLT